MQERRSTNRWRINRPCEIRLEGAESFASCTLKDLSLKGMQLALGMKLPRDTFLKLTLFCSEKCSMEVEVWVVWSRSSQEENHYGFYFSRIKDSDREKIYKFMRECYPQMMAQCWWKGLTEEEKGGEKMEDHRIFARMPVKFPMRYLEPRSGGEGFAQTQDISAKGMGIMSSDALPRKTSLEMWVEVPDKGEPLYTRGEVVWSQMVAPQKYRIGVNLEKADLMGLSRVMRVAK